MPEIGGWPMTDSTISLAARLATNLFVNAITLAKPAGRLAAKIGDRLLGFNEADAQRFLYEDALNRVEEQAEVLEPFYSDGGPAEWLPGIPADAGVVLTPDLSGAFPSGQPADDFPVGEYPDVDPQAVITGGRRDWSGIGTMASVCRLIDNLVTPSNPAGAAASEAGTGGAQIPAPDAHSPEPVAADAPGPSPAHSADSGHLLPRSEHPMYAEIQDVADAAVVADVLIQHTPFRTRSHVQCWCGNEFPGFDEHGIHVARLVIAELQQ